MDEEPISLQEQEQEEAREQIQACEREERLLQRQMRRSYIADTLLTSSRTMGSLPVPTDTPEVLPLIVAILGGLCPPADGFGQKPIKLVYYWPYWKSWLERSGQWDPSHILKVEELLFVPALALRRLQDATIPELLEELIRGEKGSRDGRHG